MKKKLVLLALAACALAALAQESAPSKTLAFDAPPSSWKPRPRDARGYLCDFDLEGGARVNVLRFATDLETFRSKLVHRWKAADGSPLAPEKIVSEKRGEKTTLLVLEGTYTPKDGAPESGWELVCAFLDLPGGAWSAWLLGPKKAVEDARAAYLKWIDTARLVEANESEMIREVRFVHGAPPHGVPGPWALTGYRIGKSALARLGITRANAFEITVTHRSPKKVQYTCMLDGLLAATGASPGKMNLVHEAVDSEEAIETIVRHAPSKRVLVYRLTKEHVARIKPVEQHDFPGAAQDLEKRKDEELFTVSEE